MKAINIYTLTRIADEDSLQKAERQMSGRNHFLSIKKWEIDGLNRLVSHLQDQDESMIEMEFYYSFQIPKLGKEFDLLRISAESIVSIELKSEEVTDDRILKQLMQNRYYLSVIGKSMRFYTYISSQDRLVRMSNSGRLVEADWSQLCEDLQKQQDIYTGHIEALFKTEEYILSPVAHPEKFLKKEYFLTSQQKDIERKIMKLMEKSSKENPFICGFTGLPGTGKSLLLYDIAMLLSAKQRICLVHCGSMTNELKELDIRLKRIDIRKLKNLDPSIEYSALLVDEAHWLTREEYSFLAQYLNERKVPAIFSYDMEEPVSGQEMDKTIIEALENLPNYERYRLTNRIRSNGELSAFIYSMMRQVGGSPRKEFPNISLLYANNRTEADLLLKMKERQGYIHLGDEMYESPLADSDMRVPLADTCFHEYDQVLVVLDRHFYYDNQHYLRSDYPKVQGCSAVRNLYHGMNRAKKSLAILVIENEPVMKELLGLLQREQGGKKQG